MVMMMIVLMVMVLILMVIIMILMIVVEMEKIIDDNYSFHYPGRDGCFPS